MKEDVAIWEVRYFTDQFQQPTEQGYVGNINNFVGTFSNSATSNSRLNVVFLIEDELAGIALFEYGSNQVQNIFTHKDIEYGITMRLDDGSDVELSGYIFASGDRIKLAEEARKTFIDALKTNEKVSFYIVNLETPTTSYLFTVETANFTDVYGDFSN